MALAHVQKTEKLVADGRRDVSTRAALLLADGDFSTACSLAEANAVGLATLDQLARAVAGTRPASAAMFLRRVVEATLPNMGPRQYQHAVDQIRQAISLKPGGEADAWVADLKARYRARRKFMELLGAATSS